MKLGANRKNVAVLAGLLLVAAVLFYINVLSDSGGGPPPQAQAAARSSPVTADAPARAPRPQQPPQAPVRRAGSRVKSSEDWRPSLKRRPEDAIDPTTIDPTLRLDLLAKVQEVPLEGSGARSVFQFSSPPPPPLPKEPKIMPKLPGGKAAEQPKPVEAGPPKPPPPPPINLKYYGFTSARGAARKTAFFLDGEDILVAAEGDLVKKRYKVVRIGVNSVVMEDVDSKSQQTLPLQEDATA